MDNDKKEAKIKVGRTYLIFAVILLISFVIILLSRGNSNSNTVRILQNGKTLYELNLDKEKDREIVINCEEGYNIIAIKNHQIFVKEADCRDQICVTMGNLEKEAMPIVCLPHFLVIEFVDDEK